MYVFWYSCGACVSAIAEQLVIINHINVGLRPIGHSHANFCVLCTLYRLCTFAPKHKTGTPKVMGSMNNVCCESGV